MSESAGRRRHAIPAWAALAIAMAHAPAALAAEWRIAPSLDVRETWSDNIRLAPKGEERTDFVTEIAPGIDITAAGPRLKLQANYRMRNQYYAKGNSGNRTQHELKALANAELVEDLLFLDGMAGISDQRLSAFGPYRQDDFHLDDNQTRVGTYRLSPYLVNRFGQTATSQLRFASEGVNSNTDGLSNTRTNRIEMRLNSGPAFKTLGWGLQYSRSHTDYNDLGSLRTQNATADLRYRLTREFSLTGSGGYEEYSYRSTAERPDGAFWTGGIAWTPTDRTLIEASAGHRFYGDTYSLNATHRTRRTAWSVNYQEDVTTSQSQFLVPGTIDTAAFLDQLWAPSIADPMARRQAVDAFMRSSGLPGSLATSVNTLTNRVFLQKRWQASGAFNTARTTLVLSAFNARREAQTGQAADASLLAASQFALDGDTRQTGVNGVWTWRIGPRTSAHASAGYTTVRALDSARKDHNTTLGVGVMRQFQPRLRGTLDLRRLESDSNIIGDTRENAISAALLMQF
ncbi:MAG: TIGR03016 family PEP-CTERM system-associated outer membrane protein [Noviherbaspirillum sp.]